MEYNKKGVVEILCSEIGAVYVANMETMPVFISFITVLVAEIENLAILEAKISNTNVDKKVQNAFVEMDELLSATDEIETIRLATEFKGEYDVNGWCELLNHCAHAIRFMYGPFNSRHAAHAAKYICRKKYGHNLLDTSSMRFENEWVSDKFYESLGRLAGTVTIDY